jgi:hypothetical protein
MLFSGGPADDRADTAVCAYFIGNWKGIFHLAPGADPGHGAAACAGVAKTKF